MTADDTAAETETSGPTTAELAERIDRQQSTLDSILAALGKGEGDAQGAAQDHEEKKLDAPTSVADEIRRQLEDRDRAKADDDWKQGVTQKLETLPEQKPETPVRKIERVMWGAR
jgi:hypothetical protein